MVENENKCNVRKEASKFFNKNIFKVNESGIFFLDWH